MAKLKNAVAHPNYYSLVSVAAAAAAFRYDDNSLCENQFYFTLQFIKIDFMRPKNVEYK